MAAIPITDVAPRAVVSINRRLDIFFSILFMLLIIRMMLKAYTRYHKSGGLENQRDIFFLPAFLPGWI
jgi:hypothetical protein